MQHGAVFVEADDIAIRQLALLTAGSGDVSVMYGQFAVTGKKRIACGVVGARGDAVCLRNAGNFVIRFPRPLPVQRRQQLLRIDAGKAPVVEALA